MSEVIDNKIVSMEFDNRQFEKNVSTTMSTLDKLKQSLKFKGATQGLEEINSASKRVDMSALGNGIETVKTKFSAMQVMAVTALANITNSAVNAGKRLVSSLTIEPINAGLSEYETQLNSVQTILANTESKGSTLEDVNAALDELNTYADKTIYNFTEMTRNIGTFTAAGVDLDTSVSAIQGIANLAAVSGSTSQQASTAMYQLSQALSSGTVRLMDWNSVVNAGMGGEVFQNALKDTARVHGVAIDDIIKKNGSFRESLQEEWLTAEILTETLNKFTMAAEEGSTEWGTYMETLKDKGYTEEQAKEILKMANTATDAATKVKTFSQLLDTLKESAQSGWAQTWEIIIGDFEAAKELWTGVSNVIGGVIGDSAEARNQVLSNALGSGWDKLMGAGIMDEGSYSEHLKNIAKEREIDIDKMIEEEGSLEKALRKCLQEEKLSANDLSLALSKLSDEYENMSDEELKAKGYSEEQRKALSALNREVQNGKISMEGYADSISKLSGREHIIESVKELYRYLNEILDPIEAAWEAIFPTDLDRDAKTLYSLLERFHEFTKGLKVSEKTADRLKRTFQGLFAILDIGLTIGKTIIKIVGGILGKIFGLGDGVLAVTANIGDGLVAFSKFIKSGDSLTKFADKVVEVFGFVIDVIKTFFATLKNKSNIHIFDGIIPAVKKVWSVIKTVFSKIGEVISNVWEQIKENFSAENMDRSFDIIFTGLLSGLGAKLIVTITQLVKKLKGWKLSDILEPFQDLVDGLGDTLGSFQQKLKADALMDVAKAVLMMVGSIIVLSLLDHGKVVQALTAVGILMGLLVGVVAAINSMSMTVNKTKDVTTTKGGLFKNVTNIKESITEAGKDTAQTVKTIGSLVGLAAAVLLLSIALKKVADMEWDEIGKGLVGVSGCIIILLGSLALIKLISKIQSNTAGTMWKLIGIVIPLIVLSGTLKKLGDMSWDQIWRGLTAMSISLVTLSGTLTLLYLASKLADKTSGKSIKGLGKIVGMLAAISTFLAIMGNLSWGQIWRGLTAMGASLGILLGVISLLAVIGMIKPGPTKTVKILKTLIAALASIAAVLALMGTMSWDQIARGLTAMSASLGILTGIVALLAVIGMIKPSPTKTLKTLKTLVGVLVVISTVLLVLGNMSWDQIARGLTGMTASLLVLTGILTLLALIKSTRKMAMEGANQLLKIAAALLIVAVSLKLLATMSWEQIGKSLLTMTVALAAMVGALAIMSKMSSPTSIVSSAGAMILIAVAINVLVPALALLGSLPLATIGKGLLAIAGMLVIFGAAAFILQPVAPILLTVAGALALFGVACLSIGVGLVALSTGLLALAGISTITAHAIVDSITILMVGIINLIPAMAVALGEGLIAICKVIGKSAYAIGEMLVSIILAALEVLVTVIPQLADGLMKILLGILDALSNYTNDLAAKICDIVFGIILTALDKLVDFIPQLIQKAVEIFMSFFIGVTNALKNMDTQTLIDGILGIGFLAALIAALGAILPLIPFAMLSIAGILAVIAGLTWIVTLIGAFAQIPGMSDIISDGGSILTIIRTAIGQFIGVVAALGAISPLVPLAIVSVAGMGVVVAGLTSLLTAIGVLAQIPGISDIIADGGNLLEKIGTAIGQFVGGIVGGIAQGVTSSLPAMGTDLSNFMTNLTPFLDGIKSLDASVLENGKTLANLLLTITAVNILEQLTSWLTGGSSLAQFASEIYAFGVGIKNFADEVSGIDPATVTAAAEAGKALGEMAKNIPTSGGLWELVAGKKDLSGFGEQLSSFGEGVKDFANQTSGVNGENVKMAAEAGKTLAQMAKEVPTSGGLWELVGGKKDLSDFGNQLKSFGQGVKDFADATVGVDGSAVKSAAEAAKSLCNIAKSIDIPTTFKNQIKRLGEGISAFVDEISGMENVSGPVSQVSELITSLNTLKTNGLDSLTTSLNKAKTDVPNAIKSMLESAIRAVKDKSSTLAKEFKAVVTSCIDAVKNEDNYNKFYSAGKYFVQGFAAGISENDYLAAAKAKAMANAAADAARVALDEHSPSKVGYEIGDFFGIAFVNAIGEYGIKAYDAAYGMASEAKDGLGNAISKVSNLIENGIDPNPTIKPVLDLTNVSNGVAAMNGMFGLNPSIGIAGSISASMNRNQNGGSTDDVISAIKDLTNKIENTASNNTYNINGISTSDADVQEAIETLVRAVTVGRRM